MAKTVKPVSILLTHRDLDNHPDVIALRNAGHTISYLEALEDFDMVIGPNCWRYVPTVNGSIKLALGAARERRYRSTPITDETEE